MGRAWCKNDSFDSSNKNNNNNSNKLNFDSPLNNLDLVIKGKVNTNSHSHKLDSVLFTQAEIIGLRLMFSLFDR